MGKGEARGPRFKRKHRLLLRVCGSGLALAWLCLMGWPTRPGPFGFSAGYFALLAGALAAAALPWWSLRRRNPEGLREHLAKRHAGLLVLASCAAGLLAAEAVVRLGRLADWGGGQGPLQTSYRLARYRLNSAGFRGEEPPRPDDRSALNILGLGDSFTFGQGVEWEETFLKRIETALNRGRGSARPIRVINASRPGWDTPQEYDFFMRQGRSYDPKVLILAYNLNDAEYQKYYLLPITGQAWEPDWLWRSHLFFLAVKVYNQRARPYEDFIAGLYREGQPGWRFGRQALADIAAACRRSQTLPLLVIFPLLQDMEHYQFAPAHEQVRQAGKAAGFEVLDLLETFRGYPEATKNLRVSRGDWHPNAEGHRLAAEAILAKLQDLRFPGAAGQPAVAGRSR